MQIELVPGAQFTQLAAAGTLAQNAEPNKLPTVFPTSGWTAEPKYDGWRIISVVGADKVTFFTRSGKNPPGALPKIEAELLANFPAGTVIDGEVVAFEIDGDKILNVWGTAQSVLTTMGGHYAQEKITYMVFDLIAHRGIDARSLSYEKRRQLLEKAFVGGTFSKVALTVQVEPTEAAYDKLVEQGFEGMILKRLNAPYASNQREGAGWRKMKATKRCEVVVTGFKEGKDSFAGMIGAIKFGQYDDDGNMVERGSCSGMDMKTRKAITADRDGWMGKVIEIQYMGLLNGNFRHPQFKRVRDDKSAEQVTLHV
jgi:ATP-dependent DNA ligase